LLVLLSLPKAINPTDSLLDFYYFYSIVAQDIKLHELINAIER